jgi:hypothetical protein
MAAAWKSAGASALLDAILYDDPAQFPGHGFDGHDLDLTSAVAVAVARRPSDPMRSPAGAVD